MVLGLRTKIRKSPSVQVNYLIQIEEIKPWPPSQSLRTLRAVVIQWEHGDRKSGSTNQAVPSLGTGSGVGDGRIEFNESFRLPVTLLKEISVKGGDGDSFQKNCIEFNLYEPRRDKTMKGQLLGTAVVDLADYGVVRETLTINAPINCKRSYRNTAQPLLFLKIQPVEKSHTRSLSRDSLMREPSMDRSVGESVSSLMNEEYADEAEIASFTDDDISSHSSLAVSSSAVESTEGSPPQIKQNGSENLTDRNGEAKNAHLLPSKLERANSDMEAAVSQMSLKGSSSRSSSVDLSSDLAWISRKIVGIQPSSSSVVPKETEKEQNTNNRNKFDMQPQDIGQQGVNGGTEIKKPIQPSTEEIVSIGSVDKETCLHSDFQVADKLSFSNSVESHANGEGDENNLPRSTIGVQEAVKADGSRCGSADDENREKHQENEQEQEISEEKGLYTEDKPSNIISLHSTMKQVSSGSDEPSAGGEDLGARKYAPTVDRSKHVKSVRSALDSNRSNGLVRNNQFVPGNSQNGVKGSSSNERKDAKVYPKDTRTIMTESKILQLECRVKMLEGELREAAALEVGLYAVVAEHGSSTNKVHAPARRLSRLYLHACKETSQSRRGSAAKSAVSGLVLVAKACGNDVPRLTFWLSNSIVLRAIVSKSFEEQQLPVSSGPITRRTGEGNKKKNISPLRRESFPSNGSRSALHDSLDDWEDPHTFPNALRRIESWIFSRIIESIWWQTLTPHMQSGAAREIRRSMGSDLRKVYRRTSSSGGEEQVNFSLELWKKAFKDACERICPVRAAGHECGCLPLLSRLIMEQCVARLDVAMFNAILRESADEIPTDPVSDPISDSEVLPIPAGKASFGAGAQLKNAIGNWSRWLTDLFGIDDDDSLEEDDCSDNTGDEREEQDASLKSFHLLNALSDLMMLPKDMLLSRTIRKEVCPLFGPPVIRRVLNTFVPDEFCPDPVPKVVLEALYSEDAFEAEEDSVINFPCTAAPICYVAPSAANVSRIFGDIGDHSQLRRSGSSVLKKSYTSDDELDELDSPLSSIIDGLHTSPSSKKPSWIPRETGSQNTMRYRLLREVWMKNL